MSPDHIAGSDGILACHVNPLSLDEDGGWAADDNSKGILFYEKDSINSLSSGRCGCDFQCFNFQAQFSD